MKNWFQLFVALFVLYALVGCTSSPTTPPVPEITVIAPSPTIEENLVEESGYPAPTFGDPYPAPDGGNGQAPPVTKVVPTSIPQTPDPNLAVVQGRILLVDQPVSGIVLYLANVIESGTGGRMVRFDRVTSIRTVTNEEGSFTFINVPPGEYGIVLDKIIDSYLLLTPEGESLIVTIAGKELLDLGDLSYEDLPIPSSP